MHPVERNTLDVLYDLLTTVDPQKTGMCIDCGAGIQDWYGIKFREWGWPALIVEPYPTSSLLTTGEQYGAFVVPAALCDQDGPVILYEGWDGNTHSLDPQWEQVTGHLHAKTEIQVRGITYPSLVSEYQLTRIACLKMDIEGSELSVVSQLPDAPVIPLIVTIEYGGGYPKHMGQGGWSHHRFGRILQCIDILGDMGYTHAAHCEETITEIVLADSPRGIWREDAGYGNLVVWRNA